MGLGRAGRIAREQLAGFSGLMLTDLREQPVFAAWAAEPACECESRWFIVP